MSIVQWVICWRRIGSYLTLGLGVITVTLCLMNRRMELDCGNLTGFSFVHDIFTLIFIPLSKL